MLLFISELNGDEWNEERGTEEWVNIIDRGGLWHVKMILHIMEEDMRKYLLVRLQNFLMKQPKQAFWPAYFLMKINCFIGLYWHPIWKMVLACIY